MRRALATVLALAPALAAAHPLGNFTVNRWLSARVTPGTIALRYVVDMAEIPAFQEIATIDRDRNGTLDEAERRAYLGRIPAELARGLVVTVDGVTASLTSGPATLELPPGAGGLPTLRLEVPFTVTLARSAVTIEVRDENFAGRAGWREIIADGSDGVALLDSTVPRTDRSAALRAYPADQLASPPQVSEARFRTVLAAAARGSLPARAPATAGSMRFADRMTELVATHAPLGPRLVVVSLALAVVLGAAHALGPGHGKSIVAAYLVGARGTARHALVLGLVVTATHTAAVYALGLGMLAASRWIVPDRLLPWISAASGLLVLAVGASLARERLTAALHGHHHHHHHHDVPADALSTRRLVALGVSGGALPCPSALVVMLGAIALGRVAFGLALIVAFSVGLAAVLTLVGVVFVRARGWLERLPGPAGRVRDWAPLASALAVSAVGVLIVARALGQMG
jgi:nickel/cobalt transporter (NicO) family protein